MPKRKGLDKSQEALDHKQTIWLHLAELRKVLFVSVIAIILGFVFVYTFFVDDVITFFSQPLIEHGVDIINIGLAEPFVAQMRASFVIGFIITSPIVIWQIWSFLRPALLPKERTTFRLMFFVILFLFITGVLFAYVYVFGITVSFFILTGMNLATPTISLDNYLRMLFNFVIPFGLAFQFPVIVYFLHRFEVVTVDGLRKKRKFVVFGLFILAAFLTPPDLVSKIMLALPMILLYEISIIFVRITSIRKKKSVHLNQT